MCEGRKSHAGQNPGREEGQGGRGHKGGDDSVRMPLLQTEPAGEHEDTGQGRVRVLSGRYEIVDTNLNASRNL